jgi:cytochrome c oxidase subunit IV
MLGWGLYGAIGGFVASGVLSAAILMLYVGRVLRGSRSSLTSTDILSHLRTQSSSILSFFAAVVLLALWMNIDVILVQHLFHSQSNTAGIYAGISVVAKFVIFLGGAIETVYFPRIMEVERIKLPYHVVRNPFLLLTLMGIVAVAGTRFLGGRVLYLFKPGFETYNTRFMLLVIFCRMYSYLSLATKILV